MERLRISQSKSFYTEIVFRDSLPRFQYQHPRDFGQLEGLAHESGLVEGSDDPSSIHVEGANTTERSLSVGASCPICRDNYCSNQNASRVVSNRPDLETETFADRLNLLLPSLRSRKPGLKPDADRSFPSDVPVVEL